jgi:ATP-dependent RNA helicase DDX49/DBP8
MELFSTVGSGSAVARVDAATGRKGKGKGKQGKGEEERGTKAKGSKEKDEKAKRKKEHRQEDIVEEEESEEEEEQEEEEGEGEIVTLASLSASTSSTSTFASLGLCSWLQQSTAAMGFRFPTDIQRACVAPVLQGRDVIGCAETGSGKTAAFALPILQHLSEDPFGVFAVVLTPTRELGIQIAEQVCVGVCVCVCVTCVYGV